MGKKSFFNGNREPNTFIGGLGAVVTTPSALASRLSLLSGQIHNFKIDANNNISCYIGRNYSSITNAFGINPYQNNLFYYIDLDGKFTTLAAGTFNNATNPGFNKVVIIPGTTSCLRSFSGGGAGTRNKWDFICAPRLQPIGASATTSDNAFSWADYTGKVFVPVFNQTSNAGAPDPDIAAAISSGIGAAISYSTNTDAPGIVTGISTVTKDTVSITIDWTPVTHTNAIQYYAIFANGVYKGRPSTGSYVITGLTTATTYEIKILAIDNMGNSSPKFSDIYVETTL